MAGETDLSHILATLHVSQQADPYVIVTVELHHRSMKVSPP
jgi:hypothetical protein